MSFQRRYLPFIIALAVIGLIVALLSFEFGADSSNHLRIANVLLDEGFLDEALWEYEQALEAGPRDYEAAVGRIYAMAGTYRLQAAREGFLAARDAHPRDPFYAFQLSVFHALQLDYHRAQELLEAAVDDGLSRAWLAYGQGVIYAASGQLKNAIEEFSKALALDPHHGPAYVRLADAHIRRGELGEARRILTEGIINSEECAYRLYPRLAWLSVAESDLNRTLQELRSILNHAVRLPSCYYTAARIALNLEVDDEQLGAIDFGLDDDSPLTDLTGLEPAERLAVLIIGQALTSDSMTARAHYHIADILYQIGDTEGALRELDLCVQNGPVGSWYESAAAEFDRWEGLRSMNAGDFTAARQSFRNVISARPTDTEARYQLARTFELEGDDDTALELYQRLIETAPDDPRGYLGLARLYAERGIFDKAVSNGEIAVVKNPVNLRAQKQLVEYYIASQRYQRAGSLLDTLIIRHPNDPEVEVLRGRLAEARNDLIGATDFYQRALNLGMSTPATARLHYALSRLYARRAREATEPEEIHRFRQLADQHLIETNSLTDIPGSL